tara:strand:+ start:584 stop:2038 length:1455 start_codon:yes stop_codon:yes gene_type:complete
MKMDYKHPLYGRRVLHVMSPVRWRSTKFMHHADSNYKVMVKTIKWLPMCHHYVLVPPNNTIPHLGDNVTKISFPYAGSVLFNRGFFDSKALLKSIDFQKIDIDFIFNHQPELLYNVYNAILTDRYGMTVDSYNFFHWVDCEKSRPTGGYPVGFFRQMEAIDLSTKSYFHCPVSLDYMKSNWDKIPHTSQGVDENVMKEKINYFPLGVGDLPEPEPFPLPDKKILVFNHRWNQSTGIKKLIQFTENLDRDEWLVWITDDEAKRPKAGKPAPSWMKVQNLPSGGQYRYLIDNCYASICLVNNYMTWNLSVQDAIKAGKPSLTFQHPTQEHVLGKDYPLYFTDKKSFLELLDNTPKNFSWDLPSHDETFKDNLVGDLIEACESNKKRTVRVPSAGIEWLHHILQDNGFKKNLLHNSHPNLYLSNTWEKIRLWCLSHGVKDDPTSKYTKLFIPDENREQIEKMVNDSGQTFTESKRDPNFSEIKNKWW